jgi:hypothetical protein
MPNRNLSPDELKRANELLKDIRQQLAALAHGDSLLLFGRVAQAFTFLLLSLEMILGAPSFALNPRALFREIRSAQRVGDNYSPTLTGPSSPNQ